MNLNPQQELAVQHIEGPLLVLASAGSGKTRVVTHRIAHLIDCGVSPSDILAVTFTNKAAGEMRTRIHTLKNAHVLACTFHSLGARLLRNSIHFLGYQKDFAIYDEEDSEKLLRSCLKLSDEKKLLKTLRQQISAAKNDLLGPDEVSSTDSFFVQTYALYQQKLKECNAVDFDDLLYLTVHLLRQMGPPHFRFLLIDEYQDTNFAQYTLAKLLVQHHSNLFAVGDPDQSIYSWRGARYQNILNFEADFPGAKIITLDQNYRSTNSILQAANTLISHNQKRFEKKLWSDLGEGAKITLHTAQTERLEADFVARQIAYFPRDVAIFYRTNAQSRPFEDALLARKIPYAIIGGISFYERREIKDPLAFLRMIVSDSDLLAFLRTINLPSRGFGAATLEKLTSLAAARAQPIFSLCEEVLERPDLLKLSARQKENLCNYVSLIRRFRNTNLKICELLTEILSASDYLTYLKEDPDTFEDRKENLNELVGKALEWEEESEDPSLSKFLEELTLRTPIETSDSYSTVKLMTLHNSKGLEFNTVFIAGLEEDLLPHINAKDSPESLEEERRLFYVGITRARQHLILTASTYRTTWGIPRSMFPSRFLKELKLSQNVGQGHQTLFSPSAQR